MTARRLVIGTRGSALALAQTKIVTDALERLHPGLDIRVERITTTGDARCGVPLSQLGRGVFVTEIETALREGRIDCAVHSAKDLPSTLADDFALAAMLPRTDARDVLVSPHGSLVRLPAGARVGTSSPRRACLLRSLRPDVEPVDIRGNVDTRLRKLAENEFDAIIIAAAGLLRLGRAAEATEALDPGQFIPAVGQGALAVEVRSGDPATTAMLQALDDPATRAAVTAERAFLAELGTGCRAAAGAHARIAPDGQLRIAAFIGSLNGDHVRGSATCPAEDGAVAGGSLARDLLRDGGAVHLGSSGSALAGRVVAVTRPEADAAPLIALLRAHGATALSLPAIAIEPVKNAGALEATLRDLSGIDWLVFTSANAVRSVADSLDATGVRLPASTRIAAVGAATAEACARRLRRPEFVPRIMTAEGLAEELPDVTKRSVLFARGDLAGDALTARLRARGALVRDVVAYRTVAGAGVTELAARCASGELAAVVFTSPSAVQFAAGALLAAPCVPSVVCIGPTTARAAREAGLARPVVSASPATGSVVETLERHFAEATATSAIRS